MKKTNCKVTENMNRYYVPETAQFCLYMEFQDWGSRCQYLTVDTADKAIAIVTLMDWYVDYIDKHGDRHVVIASILENDWDGWTVIKRLKAPKKNY